jgi:hypothetical protein
MMRIAQVVHTTSVGAHSENLYYDTSLCPVSISGKWHLASTNKSHVCNTPIPVGSKHEFAASLWDTSE